MFKVNNKDIRTTPYFTACSSVSVVNLKQVNAGYVEFQDVSTLSLIYMVSRFYIWLFQNRLGHKLGI